MTVLDSPRHYGVGLLPLHCPGCGCELSDYEVFACRLRGLKKPVCIGCLADALVTVREVVWPILEGALDRVKGL